MALPSSPRNGAKVIWTVLHDAEGARRIQDLYAFFDRNQNSSSHAGADGYALSGDWVDINRAAWTLRNGNPRSVNIELCGFARWTREQWLSEGVVDGVVNPRQMIRHAAAWARRMCDHFGIPKRRLTPEQVGRGESGIFAHWDYSLGTGDGDHWDVGRGFPWDVFFADLTGTTTQEEDDMKTTDKVTVAAPGNRKYTETDEWPKFVGDTYYRTASMYNEVLPRMEARQEAILAAVAASTNDPDITVDEMRRIVNEAVQQHVQITGTVQIGSKEGDA